MFNAVSHGDAARASDSCGGKSLHDKPHGDSFISLLQNLAVGFIRWSIAIAGPCDRRAGASLLPSDLEMPRFSDSGTQSRPATATRLPNTGPPERERQRINRERVAAEKVTDAVGRRTRRTRRPPVSARGPQGRQMAQAARALRQCRLAPPRLPPMFPAE